MGQTQSTGKNSGGNNNTVDQTEHAAPQPHYKSGAAGAGAGAEAAPRPQEIVSEQFRLWKRALRAIKSKDIKSLKKIEGDSAGALRIIGAYKPSPESSVFGLSMLMHAVQILEKQDKESQAIIQYLVDVDLHQGRYVNNLGASAISYAAQLGKERYVSILLAKHPENHKLVLTPQKNGATPLYLAAEGGHMKTVKELVKSLQHSGKSIDDCSIVKNEVASYLSKLDMSDPERSVWDFFWSSKAIKIEHKNTPALAAIIHGHLDIYNYLVAQGAAPVELAEKQNNMRKQRLERAGFTLSEYYVGTTHGGTMLLNDYITRNLYRKSDDGSGIILASGKAIGNIVGNPSDVRNLNFFDTNHLKLIEASLARFAQQLIHEPYPDTGDSQATSHTASGGGAPPPPAQGAAVTAADGGGPENIAISIRDSLAACR